MDSFISTNKIKNEYNSMDTVNLYEDFTYNIGLLEIEKYLLMKYVNKQAKILDIGCGCGRATFGMYEIGYRNIVGVDICENMINKAKEISKVRNEDIIFLNDNILNIKMKDIDVATFLFNGLMTIPGLENRKKTVNHICKILKPSGFFIFTTPIIPEDYDEKVEKINISRYFKAYRYEYGDRLFDGEYYIHFDCDDDIVMLCSDLELVETDVCERICSQKNRGYNLVHRAKYWIFRRR